MFVRLNRRIQYQHHQRKIAGETVVRVHVWPSILLHRAQSYRTYHSCTMQCSTCVWGDFQKCTLFLLAILWCVRFGTHLTHVCKWILPSDGIYLHRYAVIVSNYGSVTNRYVQSQRASSDGSDHVLLVVDTYRSVSVTIAVGFARTSSNAMSSTPRRWWSNFSEQFEVATTILNPSQYAQKYGLYFVNEVTNVPRLCHNTKHSLLKMCKLHSCR